MQIGIGISMTLLNSVSISALGDLSFLFGAGQAGFWAGGHAPAPFDMSLLFGSSTAGFYGGNKEPQQ